jgi:uncharacterized repeat protein (TIGR03803 family)
MGVVYELSPNLDGSWKMKILHGFTGGSDGGDPQAALILDATGKLYGTTSGGGLTKCGAGCGVIFELDPNANGTWKEKVLYRFSGADGENPLANVILDAAGNVYGATLSGGNTSCGSLGCGLVFELTPNVDGTWREKVLHRFTGADGDSPLGSVILDAAGNLYGTTMFGGNLSMCSGYGCGVVFTLTPNSNGVWKETVLHSFYDVPGAIPYAGAIIDAAGNLFGTTHGDGVTSFGSVFEITP